MTNTKYLTKLLYSNNPMIQKYMQTSGIVPKSEVLHSLKRFLKVDHNDVEASNRDMSHIKGIQKVHAYYIRVTPLGYRKLTNNDINVINYDVKNIHQKQAEKLHQLIRIVLTKKEIADLKSVLKANYSQVAKKLGLLTK